MNPLKEKFLCKNCGEMSVSKVRFPYPSKVRIVPENYKVRLAVGPLHIFTFILWITLFLIFSLSYIIGLETPKSIIFVSAVILITGALLITIIITIRRTSAAAVYQCSNCLTVWLLKDKETWEYAAAASGKFLKNFENPKRYIDDKTEKTWDCPNCGEKVPENYNVCWKCQASR